MNKHFLLTGICALGLTLAGFTACSDDDNNKKQEWAAQIETSDAALDPIVKNYVENVVIPTYADLVAKNEALLKAVSKFAANPGDAAFEECAQAWMEAREPWETSEAFLFGPVADKGLDPNMDSWPLDQEGIVKIMNSQDYSALDWNGEFEELDEDAPSENAQAIADAQALRGFHTLEFLIFKDGKARKIETEANEGDAANINCTRSNAAKWGAYMKAVAQRLLSDSQKLYDDWTKEYNGDESYNAIFLAHDGRSGYQSALNCLEQIIDGCADIANEVGSAKIGDPYDLFVAGKTTEALYAVESWYSWHSIDDYSNNILSIRNAYYGSRDGSINANSLAAAIRAVNPDMHTQTVTHITNAYNAIQAIPAPLRNNITNAKTVAAMEACADLENFLSKTLKPYLQQ